MLSAAFIGIILGLWPYAGPALNGSIPGTAKFSVRISGAAGETVRLRAVDVPKGYIASFCTKLVCAPFRVAIALPKSGRETIELQLIENEAGAPQPRIVIVAANHGARATIAFSRAAH